MCGHCYNIRRLLFTYLEELLYTNGYITPLLLSYVLFVNKVLTLFTCDNGSENDTGANENEHTCDPLLKIWLKIKIFLHLAITDSRYYGHQIAVPRVSAITGVDCT